MSGYKKIRIDANTTMDEHRLVWIQHNGTIPKGGIVHHKNEDKRDNRIENLELIESNSVHAKRHNPNGVWDNMDKAAFDKWREACLKAYERARIHVPEGQAWCSCCQQSKPMSAFSKNKAKRNGLQDECCFCRSKKRSKAWGVAGIA